MTDRILIWIEKSPRDSGLVYISGIWDFGLQGPDLQYANRKWDVFQSYVLKGQPPGIAKMGWYEDWNSNVASQDEDYSIWAAENSLVILEARTPDLTDGGISNSDMI